MLRKLLLIGFLTTLLDMGGQTAWAEVTEVELRIDGLSCPFCVFNIEKPLKKLGAAGSLQTNYKEGVVRMGVKPGQSVDLAQFRQAVADTGFTLRAIRLTAIGTVAQWEDHPVLETRGTGQQFLLFKEESKTTLTPEHTIGDPALERRLAGWQSSRTLVKVSGTVHEHQGLPPAMEIETILEVKP
ncbi:MAG: hypothetical protein COV76_08305 [Candidatus Omnitrophica bacterium CG11_big_fil_rev_8_21_14_0_20_64_10]|nr:MAG: hypothetical protein COV76_08305 [Candidatus Omnitrophica bacterium CG11_big_fil_rev_8_21_14_0_20_64_10]